MKPPAWDSWELDPKFFKALSQWTLDHPESTLDRVLDNVRSGIENGDSLIAFIPDSPFPARSLVTALGYLLKLGIVWLLLIILLRADHHEIFRQYPRRKEPSRNSQRKLCIGFSRSNPRLRGVGVAGLLAPPRRTCHKYGMWIWWIISGSVFDCEHPVLSLMKYANGQLPDSYAKTRVIKSALP